MRREVREGTLDRLAGSGLEIKTDRLKPRPFLLGCRAHWLLAEYIPYARIPIGTHDEVALEGLDVPRVKVFRENPGLAEVRPLVRFAPEEFAAANSQTRNSERHVLNVGGQFGGPRAEAMDRGQVHLTVVQVKYPCANEPSESGTVKYRPSLNLGLPIVFPSSTWLKSIAAREPRR